MVHLINQLRFLHVLAKKSNLTRKETDRKLKSTEIIATTSTEFLRRDLKEKGDWAVKVRADGDCLPASGNVFIYDNDKHPSEIRTQIIVEQVSNEYFYLDEQKLLRGYKHNIKSNTLMKSYAMYSDEYMYDRRLSNDEIKEIYRR